MRRVVGSFHGIERKVSVPPFRGVKLTERDANCSLPSSVQVRADRHLELLHGVATLVQSSFLKDMTFCEQQLKEMNSESRTGIAQ
jgi:hypothetical protein